MTCNETLRRLRAHLIGLIVLFWLVLPIWAQQPTLIYLVRHAEKQDTSRDADLSPQGFARAEQLAHLFAQVHFDGLYASEFQRTQKTLAPLAQKQGQQVLIRSSKEMAGLVAELQAKPGGTFLIAGHSNTLPELIHALGGPSITIDDGTYGDLFLLICDGAVTRFQHLQLPK